MNFINQQYIYVQYTETLYLTHTLNLCTECYCTRGRHLNASITRPFLSCNQNETAFRRTWSLLQYSFVYMQVLLFGGRRLFGSAVLCVIPTSCFPPWKTSDQLQTHTCRRREGKRASATHTLRGNPISWKSRVTLQLNTHLTRSCPKSAGHAHLCSLKEKETRSSCLVFKPLKYKKNRGARAGEKHGVFHGTSSEGALLATFQENRERSNRGLVQVRESLF